MTAANLIEITKIKKNMKNSLMNIYDKLMLKPDSHGTISYGLRVLDGTPIANFTVKYASCIFRPTTNRVLCFHCIREMHQFAGFTFLHQTSVEI